MKTISCDLPVFKHVFLKDRGLPSLRNSFFDNQELPRASDARFRTRWIMGALSNYKKDY